jgi:hypothetical protein
MIIGSKIHKRLNGSALVSALFIPHRPLPLQSQNAENFPAGPPQKAPESSKRLTPLIFSLILPPPLKAPLILLGLWAFCLHAQNASTSIPTPGYVITQRALNSRVWQEPSVTTNVDGTVSTNISAYTEVRSGLCYMNEGVLADSSDEIDLVADGAQAVHGQHSVHWNANLDTLGGAIRLVTAGGQVLQSTVFGIRTPWAKASVSTPKCHTPIVSVGFSNKTRTSIHSPTLLLPFSTPPNPPFTNSRQFYENFEH